MTRITQIVFNADDRLTESLRVINQRTHLGFTNNGWKNISAWDDLFKIIYHSEHTLVPNTNSADKAMVYVGYKPNEFTALRSICDKLNKLNGEIYFKLVNLLNTPPTLSNTDLRQDEEKKNLYIKKAKQNTQDFINFLENHPDKKSLISWSSVVENKAVCFESLAIAITQYFIAYDALVNAFVEYKICKERMLENLSYRMAV